MVKKKLKKNRCLVLVTFLINLYLVKGEKKNVKTGSWNLATICVIYLPTWLKHLSLLTLMAFNSFTDRLKLRILKR